ncbi:MAG: hypothetical protein K1X83_00140 [Oligoflexia bacterium]|nr:hypothetical protein [Oligoflexia bacterium]
MMQALRTHRPLALAAVGVATFAALEAASFGRNRGDAHFEAKKTIGPHSELAHTRIVYLCGVDADEAKVSRHTEATCAIGELALTQPFEFIYFHNNTNGLLLDWFEAVQFGVLTTLHLPDPVASSMIDLAYAGIVERLEADPNHKELLIGHSEGAHFALALSRRIVCEKQALADRVFVLYIEPMGAVRPPSEIGFAEVTPVQGHKLDFYLRQRTNLAHGLKVGMEELERRASY